MSSPDQNYFFRFAMRYPVHRCLFKKSIHSIAYNFFLSWILETWLIILLLSEKVASHVLHLNGFFPSWSDATCLIMLLFSEQLKSQMLFWNSFSPPWTDATCFHATLFKTAVVTNVTFEWLFLLHELTQHVYSCYSLEHSCSHKFHIWMACFLHAQIQHVYSCYSLKNSCSCKCHI